MRRRHESKTLCGIWDIVCGDGRISGLFTRVHSIVFSQSVRSGRAYAPINPKPHISVFFT